MTRREYCDLKAFGLNWERSAKGHYINLANIWHDRDTCKMIFDTWRENKSLLKEAGFSLFKTKDGAWIFFFRNCPQDEMIDRLSTFKAMKADRKETGQHLGKVGERMQFTGELFFTKAVSSIYGTSMLMKFKVDGNIVICFYSGIKELPEPNVTIDFKATVKKHEIYDGSKQTVVNRIAW